MTREESLGKEPVLPLMIKMGMPTLAAQVINLLYNIVDRSYIGHISGTGAAALTGVGLALPVIIIITAFASIVGGGGAPLAAIALGSGNRKRASEFLGNGFMLLVLMAVILTIVFFPLKHRFLFLIGASSVTFPYADQYLSIYLCGTLFVQISVGLNTFITAQGNAKTAMLSVAIGAILNIILDPLFIFVFGMGVRGAALATVISQAVSALWVLHFLFSGRATLKLEKKYMRPDGRIIVPMISLGVSPFVMQATEALISIVMNSGLQKYGGDLYVGALTVMQAVMQFATVPAGGFSQGIQPVVSYNYGAGQTDRVKKTVRYLVILLESCSMLIVSVALIHPALYVHIFTNDEALTAFIVKTMPLFMTGMMLFGIQMALQSVFVALGQAKLSIIIALLRKVVLLVPLALILPAITGKAESIYIAEPVSDCISVTVCTILFIANFKAILNDAQKK
ncbi:MAG: MATE family efflux transporter [Treponema sp.]|nr:MATE family efflux transporter [Treponema sp.]